MTSDHKHTQWLLRLLVNHSQQGGLWDQNEPFLNLCTQQNSTETQWHNIFLHVLTFPSGKNKSNYIIFFCILFYGCHMQDRCELVRCVSLFKYAFMAFFYPFKCLLSPPCLLCPLFSTLDECFFVFQRRLL